MALVTRNQKLKEILATSKGKTYATALLTILVVVLMISLAVVPAYLSITNQNASNLAKKEYLQELEQREADLKRLAQQEVDLNEEIELLADYYPLKRNDEYMLANLARLSEKYELELTGISFAGSELPATGQLTSFTNARVVPFNFTVVGDVSKLQLLLSHLESFPTLITIESVGYNSNSEKRTIANPYNMSVQAYYFYWTEL